MNSKNFLNIANGIFEIIFFLIMFYLNKDVGVGIFICAYLLFKVLYIIMMGSIRITIAKMVAARRFRGFYEQSKNVFRLILTYSIFVGLIFGVVLLLFGDIFATIIFGNTMSGSVISVFGIYFTLKAVCDCISGYYIGCNNGSLVFIAEIVNGIVKVILCPVFIKLISQYGNKVSSLLKNEIMNNCYGVIGATFSLCVAMLIMLVILILGSRGNFSKGKQKFTEMKFESKRQFMNTFFNVGFSKLKDTAFPYVVYFILVLVYVRANKTALSVFDLYSNIGSFSSKVFIILSLQTTLFGEYVYYYRTKMKSDFKKDEIKNFTGRINSLIKSSLILILPLAVSILAYAKPIANTLFASADESGKTIVVITAICIIFSGLDKVFTSILESAGYDLPVTIGKIAALLASSCYAIWLAIKGISTIQLTYGVLIYYLIMCIIHALFTFKNMNIRINDVIAKLISVVISAGLMLVLDVILNRFLNMNILILAICFICGYVLYIVSLIAIRGVNQKDIANIKWTILYYPMNFIGGLFGIR